MSLKLTDRCLKDFVYYRWERKQDGFTVCSSLMGVPADKKGYIHKALGYNEFEKIPIKISEGYQLVEPNDYLKNRITDHYCRKKRPEPELKGLEIEKWQNEAKQKFLTVSDIGRLKKGDTIKVLVLDRNLYDIVLEINDSNALYNACEFFRYNSATYVHEKGLQGKITYHFNNEDLTNDPFEFDVEFAEGNWYPLKNGYLPAEDEQGCFKLLGRKTKWDEFPLDTHIGWRGPMMFWEDVKKMPDIYWYDP